MVRAGNSEIRTQKTYNDDNTHYFSIYNNINGWENSVQASIKSTFFSIRMKTVTCGYYQLLIYFVIKIFI